MLYLRCFYVLTFCAAIIYSFHCTEDVHKEATFPLIDCSCIRVIIYAFQKSRCCECHLKQRHTYADNIFISFYFCCTLHLSPRAIAQYQICANIVLFISTTVLNTLPYKQIIGRQKLTLTPNRAKKL